MIPRLIASLFACLLDWIDLSFVLLIDWLIDCLIDWLSDWLIDCSIDWLTDWSIDWLIDWFNCRFMNILWEFLEWVSFSISAHRKKRPVGCTIYTRPWASPSVWPTINCSNTAVSSRIAHRMKSWTNWTSFLCRRRTPSPARPTRYGPNRRRSAASCRPVPTPPSTSAGIATPPSASASFPALSR